MNYNENMKEKIIYIKKQIEKEEFQSNQKPTQSIYYQ